MHRRRNSYSRPVPEGISQVRGAPKKGPNQNKFIVLYKTKAIGTTTGTTLLSDISTLHYKLFWAISGQKFFSRWGEEASCRKKLEHKKNNGTQLKGRRQFVIGVEPCPQALFMALCKLIWG